MGLLGAAQKQPLHKICNTYLKMMKLDSYTLIREDPENKQIT